MGRNPDLENEKAGRGGFGGVGRYSDHDDRGEGPAEPKRREVSPGPSWSHDLFELGNKRAEKEEKEKEQLLKEKREDDAYDPLEAPEKVVDKGREKDEKRSPAKATERSRKKAASESDDDKSD